MKRKKKTIDTFLEISAYLTGFSEVELEGTGLLGEYFQVVMERPRPVEKPIVPTNAELFMAEAADILRGRRNDNRINAEIARRLMPDAAYQGLAKQIITLWYMGSWGNNVVSPASYVQGLIWDIAESHPPGAKQPGYGSWAIPPINVSTK